MTRKMILFLMVALVLSLTIVGGAAAQDTLKIGLLTDQSGGLTIYGYELEYGFKLGLVYAAELNPADYNNNIDDALAAVTIGGRPVEVVLRDNGSDPDTAASQARDLVEQEGVEILVGAPSSAVTLSLQQVALDYNVLLFAAPGASPAITGDNFNPNTFRVCRNTFQDSLALASFATEGLGTNWVILAADYDFGRSSATAFQTVLGGSGVTFVQDTIFAPLETTDFTSYLQAVLDSGADTLLPIWAGETTIALFQQIAEMGVPDQMNVVGAFNSNDIMAASDPSAVGTISWIVYHYTFPQNEVNDWLVENHRAVYNDVPDLFTECAFATAQALSSAVNASAGDTLPESLTPNLEGLIFSGPKGTYGIRPSDHQVLVPMYIAQLTNLDSPDFAYYELLAEVPAQSIVPPVLLPEAFADRVALDTDFMAEFMAISPEATEPAQ